MLTERLDKMKYYIYIENGKINGAGQAKVLNENILNYETTQLIFEDYIENKNKYIWDETTQTIINNPNYEQEQAEKIKNELIEQVNYPLKAQIAYTGVRFDYQGDELVFETNETSISMVNFTAMMAQQAQLSEITNWKCRKTVEPFEPVSVTFTMTQFQQLLAFASQMVLQAFAVEEQINLQIQQMTVEQLNNEEYVEAFKNQMAQAYLQVPIKIENLFETQETTQTPIEEI